MTLLFKNSILLSAICSVFISNASIAANDKFSIQPFAAYRFGGDFDQRDNDGNKINSIDLDEGSSFGLVLSWPYDNKRKGQLFYSHQSTEFDDNLTFATSSHDINIQYLHIGGSIPLDSNVVPFWFSGGLGVSHFSPDANNLDNETKLSANLGINTQFQVTEQVDLVFGARVYATFFDSDSKIFCDSAQCLIEVSSNVWIQSELSAGLSIAF